MLPFSKDGQPHLDGLPIEEIVIAGPCVNFGIADSTFETTGTIVLMFLSRRGIIHPATGAGKLFGHPYAVGHPNLIKRVSARKRYLPQYRRQ
jgi:hypothetical protein